ncbi:unnamed protein product, partial [Owenia fusiformis]
SVSIYMLGLLSLDRYIAIIHPLHYNVYCSKKRAYVAMVTVWVFSFMFWLLSVLGISRVIYIDSVMLCNPDPSTAPVLAISAIILILLITSIVILYCSIKILNVVIRQSKQISPEGGRSKSWSMKSSMKGIRTLLVIVTGFYVAWTPHCTEWIVVLVVPSAIIPVWVQRMSRLLCNSNSFWNAIIYTVTNSQFRRAALRMLCCNKATFSENT